MTKSSQENQKLVQKATSFPESSGIADPPHVNHVCWGGGGAVGALARPALLAAAVGEAVEGAGAAAGGRGVVSCRGATLMMPSIGAGVIGLAIRLGDSKSTVRGHCLDIPRFEESKKRATGALLTPTSICIYRIT